MSEAVMSGSGASYEAGAPHLPAAAAAYHHHCPAMVSDQWSSDTNLITTVLMAAAAWSCDAISRHYNYVAATDGLLVLDLH